MTSSMHVERVLWEAADALRDVVEVRLIGEWMLALLFIKYVADARPVDAGDKPARFVVPDSANFYTLLKRCHEPGNAARLDAALALLAGANPKDVADLFADVKFVSGPNVDNPKLDRALGEVLRQLALPELELASERLHDGAVASALGLVLTRFVFASYSNAGEFYSPRQVARLMMELLAAQPGNHIHDPACGSGGFLLAAANYIQEHHGSHHYVLSGQERSRSACKVATMNLLLHGIEGGQIACGDSLRNPKFVVGDNQLQRFDVLLANPPFSLSDWGAEQAERDRFGRFRFGVPPRGRADYAFILHMVASMKPNTGRAAVVVPHGVLFRGGSEALIRSNLIKAGLLDAVIGLPSKLFHNSGIPTAILLFRARPSVAEDSREDILFIDASGDFALGRKMNELRAEDIERVATTYHQRQTVPGYASVVPYDAIAAKEYSLSIPLYVSSQRERSQVDLDALLVRQRELEDEVATIRSAIDGIWDRLSLSK